MTDTTDDTTGKTITPEGAPPPTAADGSSQTPPEATGADPYDTESGWMESTLGEQGPVLPIGVEVGGKLHKTFEHQKWKFKQERELGKIKEDHPGMSMGEFVTAMIGHMFTSIGPHQLKPETSQAEKALLITQLYMGDVMYMWSWLRRQSLGPHVDALMPCPYCRTKNKQVLDLNDLDIRTTDDPGRLRKEVELQDGLVIYGELRTSVTVRPATWYVMQSQEMTATENDAVREALMIRECVCGAEGLPEGRPIMITDEDMDELSKIDLLRIIEAIENTPGPQMAIELKCEKCKQLSVQVVDWSFDSFFGTPSLSKTGRH